MDNKKKSIAAKMENEYSGEGETVDDILTELRKTKPDATQNEVRNYIRREMEAGRIKCVGKRKGKNGKVVNAFIVVEE